MKIFLSYRRDDTGGRAGRLFDVLVARFGARNVFQDVTTVAPGRDFAAQVDAAVTDSDAVLVVIGPSWLGITDQGGRRIDHPDDFVRREGGHGAGDGDPGGARARRWCVVALDRGAARGAGNAAPTPGGDTPRCLVASRRR